MTVVALLVAAASDARADAQSDLEKAHSAYMAHKYDEAEARLRALLDARSGSSLKDADSVGDARMYLAAVLLAEGKKDDAETVLEQLLLERPDYQPDPLRVSLQAVDALIDARSRLRDKLVTIQAEKVKAAQEEKTRGEAETRKAALRLAMLEKLAGEEIITERHSRWIALIPFGAGQFQNGQEGPGWALLVSESLLAAGSAVGAGLMLYDVGLTNDALARKDGTASGYLQRAQQASIAGDLFAAGFGLVAAAGIVHAQLEFVPQRVEVRKRPIPPVEVAPVVGAAGERGDGVYLGVRGRF